MSLVELDRVRLEFDGADSPLSVQNAVSRALRALSVAMRQELVDDGMRWVELKTRGNDPTESIEPQPQFPPVDDEAAGKLSERDWKIEQYVMELEQGKGWKGRIVASVMYSFDVM
jgi:hypothetical protein